MESINALSLTFHVNDWMASSRQPRVLHIFDHACNLINERRDVLSIVTAQIGNGPFNLVVEGDVLFSTHLKAESLISILAHHLVLGDLVIDTASPKLWSARPDWEILHSRKNEILDQLTSLPSIPFPSSLPTSPLSTFITSLIAADMSSCLLAAKKLAGLGIGLTPAGDDFVLGAIYAAWIIHSPKIALILAEGISSAARPITTSLSAAWLRSAGRGEAGILWHVFFDALRSCELGKTREAMDKIAAVGETSGMDALAGFTSTLISYQESRSAF